MGISYKDFKAGNFEGRVSSNREEHPVYLFLKKNKNSAFRIKEICKAIKMKEDTVRGMMTILIKLKLVEHKQPYFALRR